MKLFSAQNQRTLIRCTAVLALIFGYATSQAIAATAVQQELLQLLQGFDRAAVSLQNDHGDSLVAFNQDQPMVPASTVKLLTGLMALEQLGDNFRATTDLYFDRSTSTLTVVGNGDPFLVSEEIKLLAAKLQAALRLNGIGHIASIRLDNTRFRDASGLSWQSATANPYDAVPSALAANFNTMKVSVENGRPVSGEEQTPMTRLTWQWTARQPDVSLTGDVDKLTGLPLLKPLSTSIGRINTGVNVVLSARYFGELLASFLWQQGMVFIDSSGASRRWSGKTGEPLPLVMLADSVSLELATSDNNGDKAVAAVARYGELIYTHSNSRSLSSVVAAMLQYSTNFIANNLALMLASDKTAKPAGFDDFRQMAEDYAMQRFAWQDIVLQEGAGLSLANRLSTAQLVQLTAAFKSRQDLLPVYKASLFELEVFAKTGSLKGVSTLAGVIRDKSEKDHIFAILIQDDSIIDSRARDRVLQLLIKHLE